MKMFTEHVTIVLTKSEAEKLQFAMEISVAEELDAEALGTTEAYLKSSIELYEKILKLLKSELGT